MKHEWSEVSQGEIGFLQQWKKMRLNRPNKIKAGFP